MDDQLGFSLYHISIKYYDRLNMNILSLNCKVLRHWCDPHYLTSMQASHVPHSLHLQFSSLKRLVILTGFVFALSLSVAIGY